ncbi:hypothetical protein BC832DRAFT_446356 [Gaertneriomyces semiglobifer]|nr:hypothetical protein BC832DRAFT_446356 [Gaertneriomyces semiglobifer]
MTPPERSKRPAEQSVDSTDSASARPNQPVARKESSNRNSQGLSSKQPSGGNIIEAPSSTPSTNYPAPSQPDINQHQQQLHIHKRSNSCGGGKSTRSMGSAGSSQQEFQGRASGQERAPHTTAWAEIHNGQQAPGSRHHEKQLTEDQRSGSHRAKRQARVQDVQAVMALVSHRQRGLDHALNELQKHQEAFYGVAQKQEDALHLIRKQLPIEYQTGTLPTAVTQYVEDCRREMKILRTSLSTAEEQLAALGAGNMYRDDQVTREKLMDLYDALIQALRNINWDTAASATETPIRMLNAHHAYWHLVPPTPPPTPTFCKFRAQAVLQHHIYKRLQETVFNNVVECLPYNCAITLDGVAVIAQAWPRLKADLASMYVAIMNGSDMPLPGSGRSLAMFTAAEVQQFAITAIAELLAVEAWQFNMLFGPPLLENVAKAALQLALGCKAFTRENIVVAQYPFSRFDPACCEAPPRCGEPSEQSHVYFTIRPALVERSTGKPMDPDRSKFFVYFE